MFIELPQTLAAATDLVLEPDEAFDAPQTLTAVQAERGARGGEASSRIRVALARDARQWPAHASVDAGEAFELTFTAAA